MNWHGGRRPGPQGWAIGMNEPQPTTPGPGSSPRLHKTGRQERGKPIVTEWGGNGFSYWEVEVTPLLGATQEGGGHRRRQDEAAGYLRGEGAVLRARLAAFGSRPNTRLVQETLTSDEELARAIARVCVNAMCAGRRDLELVDTTIDVECGGRDSPGA